MKNITEQFNKNTYTFNQSVTDLHEYMCVWQLRNCLVAFTSWRLTNSIYIYTYRTNWNYSPRFQNKVFFVDNISECLLSNLAWFIFLLLVFVFLFCLRILYDKLANKRCNRKSKLLACDESRSKYRKWEYKK